MPWIVFEIVFVWPVLLIHSESQECIRDLYTKSQDYGSKILILGAGNSKIVRIEQVSVCDRVAAYMKVLFIAITKRTSISPDLTLWV